MHFVQECPAGVEPALPAWKAGTSAARSRARTAEGEGVEPSRLIARLFSRQLPSPIGLPFRSKAAVTGIEPVSGRLTVAFPYQHGTHRIDRGVWKTKHSASFHTPRFKKSAQRESNPHFRHGKATGCRYIMGAWLGSIVKEQTSRAPSGTRTHVAALRVRCPGRWTTGAN